MPLSPGTTLGPYQIDAPLGAGGMGEVYQATDTRLDRTVAIKVLPEHVASDPDLKQRFEREARTVAALNHPHICTLYDIGSQDGIDFLVMEYLEGETVAQRLEKGALPLDQALQIAIDIADALDKAHRQGIVHRDLKPANIMLTKSGAKLLDFGLAKLKPADQAGGLSALPTQPADLTQQGAILGTFQYMAPEQLEGQEADARTDIFAFGTVVYEMVTGKKAFEGKSQASLISAIMSSEPPAMSELQAMSPAALDPVVKTCLAKNPDDRWQSVGDVGRQLQLIASGSHSGVVVSSQPVPATARWRQGLPLLVTTSAVVALVSGLAVWGLTLPVPPQEAVARFSIPLGPDESFTATGQLVTLSPDGKQLVYQANNQLFLRPLDETHATPIRGTQGASNPFVSPDGEWIGFWTRGQLKRVAMSGGAAVTLGEAGPVWGANWGEDDMIRFGQAGAGIWQVPATGGTREVVIETAAGEFAHGPQLLPGGEWLLFTLRPAGAAGGVGWSQAQVVVQSLVTGERQVVFEGARDARYVSTGHLMYALDGVLLAVPFDVDAQQATGGPVPLVEGVAEAGIANGGAYFAVSNNGSLVYVLDAGRILGAPGGSSLGWVDRHGEMTPAITDWDVFGWPRLSPDDTRVAAAVGGTSPDIWIWDLDGGIDRRLTDGGGVNVNPWWTPDGASVTFFSSRAGSNVYSRPVDGSGEAELLAIGRGSTVGGGWSPDGQTFIYSDGAGDQSDLWTVSPGGDPAPFLVTEDDERGPQISPDGQWVVYISDQAGEDRVYVQPFPDGGEVIPVSPGKGTQPVWSRAGGELFYRDGNQMYVVEIDTQPTFRAGRPRVLFEGPYDMGPGHDVGIRAPNYDVSLDGERFLMVTRDDSEASALSINVVLNFFEELKARVPVD